MVYLRCRPTLTHLIVPCLCLLLMQPQIKNIHYVGAFDCSCSCNHTHCATNHNTNEFCDSCVHWVHSVYINNEVGLPLAS